MKQEPLQRRFLEIVSWRFGTVGNMLVAHRCPPTRMNPQLCWVATDFAHRGRAVLRRVNQCMDKLLALGIGVGAIDVKSQTGKFFFDLNDLVVRLGEPYGSQLLHQPFDQWQPSGPQF